MRNWLLKFRISTALDAGKEVAPALRRQGGRSPAAARFLDAALALDQALKRGPAEYPTPDGLHQAIMNSVRSAQRRAAPRPHRAFPGWLAPAGATACVALLAGGLWLHFRSSHLGAPTASHAATVPPSAPDVRGLVAEAAPVSVVSPLAQEFQNLSLDLDRTERFLLAALP